MTTTRPRRPQPRQEQPAGPAYPQMLTGAWFPPLAARDLDGHDVALPAGLPGQWNIVIAAFQRRQQELADSWVPWLEERAATTPGLRFVELPSHRDAVAAGPASHRRRDGGGHPRPADTAAQAFVRRIKDE